ncbi:MAG TPA: hypothetical protein VGM81_16430 [Burkholderiaceae bacterium]|jgi:hypothetical protein
MTQNLRGFSHPAEALRAVLDWRLQALQTQLLAATKACDAARDTAASEQSQLAAAAVAVRSTPIQVANTGTHQLHMKLIMEFMRRTALAEAEHDAATKQVEEIRQRCREHQVKLLGLEKVHAAALADFVTEGQRKALAELDAAVLIRDGWASAEGVFQ